MQPFEIENAIRTAFASHDAGQFAQAEAIYRQILAHAPDHDEALHGLGMLALQVHRPDLALEPLRRATVIQPHVPAYHGNLGNAWRALGRLEEAASSYRQALALMPDLAEAHNNLGAVLFSQGKADEAIACYRRALDGMPNYPEAHYNLGAALYARGDLDEASAACRLALALRPDYFEAHNNLGIALHAQGKLEQAIASYRRALALRPSYAEAHCNLSAALHDQGILDEAVSACRRALELQPEFAEAHSSMASALAAQGKYDEAVAAGRRAVALKPEFAEAHNNLGIALSGLGTLAEAIACYRWALELRPDFAKAHNNLGNALREQMRLDEAGPCFDEAIRLEPRFDEAYVNRALLLLLRGDFERGWADYEWRWQTKNFAVRPRSIAQPRWDGQPLEERSLLVHCEQGFGSTIQFIRYVALIAQAGSNVIVECQPELRRLLRGSLAPIRVFDYDEPLPPFDVQCPVLSLPQVFRTTVATIPCQIPYVKAQEESIARWRGKVGARVGPLKVGLAWAGNPRQKNDHHRSMPLRALAPLGRVTGFDFYSLQKGEAGLQALDPPPGMGLIDWTNALMDFAETAALISNLDLVISVDTAIAHLAGAMGKPVWTLLCFAGDWHHLLEPETNPWYPTMRLFRQAQPGDWQGVAVRVAEALLRIAQKSGNVAETP